jgi:protein ImuB
VDDERPDPVPRPKAQANSTPRPRPQAQANSTPRPEAQANSTPRPEAQANSTPRPEAQANPTPRPEAQANPTPQARLFERVLVAVADLCPRVEVIEPGVCAFAARGPARYFGGETIVAEKIIAALAAIDVDCRIGIADGIFAALLAAGDRAREASGDHARVGDCAREGAVPDTRDAITLVPPGGSPVFLGRQPVGVLDDQELAGLLHRLGIRTLADLAALSERDVASRFGAAGEKAHRLASGLDARPLAAQPPAEDLSVSQEFDPPETLAEPLVFAAKALAEDMHAKLAAKGLTCVRVQVQAMWEDGTEHSRLWRHDGLLTAVQVADRVRWQLDGWRSAPRPETQANPMPRPETQASRTLEAQASRTPPQDRSAHTASRLGDAAANADGPRERHCGGVVLLRLTPDQVVRATGQQLALWGEAVITDRVARAAMRVQALLGHDAVLRPLLSGGRNVHDRVTLSAFWEEREPARPADQPWPGQVPGPAPAIVYPAPREASVTDEAGRVVTVSGRCVVSAPPHRLAIRDELGHPTGRDPGQATGPDPGHSAKRESGRIIGQERGRPTGRDRGRVITGWAGPWPLTERWWDPETASRRARFQLVTDDGRAWLAAVRDGRWQIEAGYW